MEWYLTKEDNFETYVLELSDASLKVVTTMPSGTLDDCMGMVLLKSGHTLPVFNKENKNAYGNLQQIKQMTLATYKKKEIVVAAIKEDRIYDSLIFQ